MLTRSKYIVLALAQTLALVAIAACDSEPFAEDGGPPSSEDGGSPPPLRLPGFGLSSECGGYERTDAQLQAEHAYCDAEVLTWSYDASTEMLSVLHERYETNCCGEREMRGQLVGEEYQIVEIETSRYGGDTPCGCRCVFDLEISIPVPDKPSIAFSLILDGRTPWDETLETLWSGTLDLTAGSGEIVLDDAPSTYCEPTETHEDTEARNMAE